MSDNNPESTEKAISRSEFLKMTGGFATSLSLLGYLPLSSSAQDEIAKKLEVGDLEFQKVGRGLCEEQSGILKTQNTYAAIGNTSWSNYELSFNAEVPAAEDEAHIWAGIRASDRYNRYIVGLKGGGQNNLFLARLGHIGTDEFLALRETHFPVEPGQKYAFKIQVVGDRIRIFLNDEPKPHIDILDKNSSMAAEGKASLGGGWTETKFTNVSLEKLPGNALNGVSQKEFRPPQVNKQLKRKNQRAAYRPVEVHAIGDQRTEVSLDGEWLFQPNHKIGDASNAVSQDSDDQDWNVLEVPNFWNPNKVWLYGDSYKGAFRGVANNYDQGEINRCESYTFDYKKTNIGWYRQWINLPEGIEDKHLELHFDAVSKLSEVWINGERAGGHTGMFGEFSIDGTGLFKPGKNVIAVKVYKKYAADESSDDVAAVAVSVEITEKMLNSLPHGMYHNDPAGIWQPVSLVISNPVKIEDVFIKPNLNGAAFEVMVKNYTGQPQSYSLNTQILPVEGSGELHHGESLKDITLQAGESETLTFEVNSLKPKLWTPSDPNLYNFYFRLKSGDTGEVKDMKKVRSGFRTFEAQGDYFYLNDKKYWLRGGNLTAMPIAPNDAELADKFTKLMQEGNIHVTRTHASPFTEAWMEASDRNGIGVSYEGIWPWLMYGGSPIPSEDLLDIWKKEFFDLIKKYRNHPSLLIWTVNNEMKFFEKDPDIDRTKKKVEVLSDVIKQMREMDPTHPICINSHYNHKQTEKRLGEEFMDSVDDGDIDDMHTYPNWYSRSIFDCFKGEFQKKYKYEGRPLINQEMSTGYPDQSGHCTLSYLYTTKTPSSLMGKYAYSYDNPAYFKRINAFLTKEAGEALRRSNEKAAGILQFSLSTWFANVYQPDCIKPYPAYHAAKKALQPVLISAELWGRNYYAGAHLPVRFCIVNDHTSGEQLPETSLHWRFLGEDGEVLKDGTLEMPAVEHYGRKWISPDMTIPENLPKNKNYGKLELELQKDGDTISENEYELLLGSKKWPKNADKLKNKKLVVVDASDQITPVLDFLDIDYNHQSSVQKALQQEADAFIFSGVGSESLSSQKLKKIKSLMQQGANTLWLNTYPLTNYKERLPWPKEGTKVKGEHKNFLAKKLYPQHFHGVNAANPQIVTMDIPESPVFDDIEPLDTRYFNDDQRDVPLVCSGAYQVNRNSNLETLATSVQVHFYLGGDVSSLKEDVKKLAGYPIVKINDQQGSSLFSTMMLEKGTTDPVAAKLLSNMVRYLG